MFVWRWLTNVPMTDPVERRLAPLLQLVLFALAIIPIVETTRLIVNLGLGAVPVSFLLLTVLVELVFLFIVFMLRRGRFKAAVTVLLTIVLLGAANGLRLVNLEASGEVLIAFFVPLTIAGLLLSRWALVAVYLVSVVLVVFTARSQSPTGAVTSSAVFYITYATLISFLLDLLGRTLRQELMASRSRNEELKQAHHALENSSLELETLNTKLQALNERLIVTLKSIGDAVITTDVDGRVTFINEVAQSLTGWTPEDAVGRPIAEVFHIVNEETRQIVENPVDRVLREGVIVGLANHTILLTRDGREVPIDDSGAPIRTEQGQMHGVVLVFRDVSERRAMEQGQEELLQLERRARHEAEKADQLKLQFLAMISHELRTPLTSIKGFSTTLLADDVEWTLDNQQDFIRIIDEESDKLTELVEQLLDISRMQSGTLRINVHSQTIDQLVAAVQTQLERLSVDHQLVFRVPENLPPVKVDQQRMIQVLDNLVENAIKYSPKNSTIEINFSQKNGFIQVDVADEGIGIPSDDHHLVFEAFRQVERKEQAKGAGLGLAICKGLIEQHGGSIWIQDKTPGTTISFTLPISEN